MRYATVCSGIEAPTVACQHMDWWPQFFSEIEPFPCAVLKHHYPDVPNYGDMTKFKEWPDAELDLICGGTPCQSFSVAGLRKGLDDPRGNLMLTFGAIADRYRPAWLVWENVPGVLSSNGGRDFGTFLGMLGKLGYGFAYRILDAQFFGVPQRRRRVFVVGYLGDWRRAAAVLFERQSLQGHPAPRREKGKGFAADSAPSLTASGRGVERTGETRGQDPVIAVHAPEIARCIATREGTSQDYETPTMVAHSLRAEGFDASEDGTGRGTPLVPVSVPDVGMTLTSGGRGERGRMDPVNTDMIAFAIQGAATRENPSSGPDGVGVRDYDTAYTLEARSEVQAVAFDSRQDCISSETYFGALGSSSPQAQAVALRGREGGATAELSEIPSALRASGGGGDKAHVLTSMQVRRLTPRECERLQGFPDDYTLITVRNKPAADGPRYKALGNSMAVPVVRWIGERIEMVRAWRAAA